MTYQVKEGDVLEYRGDGESKRFHNFTIGKRYVVKRDGLGVYIVSDTGKRAIVAALLFETYGFHLVATTPPETIQHEGYNYTRGEPVVPEWVKDGAWVVNIYSDELRKVEEVKPGVFDLVVNDLVSIRYQDAIRGHYRPFTNEDWKWGMWAEYKGERVFVMGASFDDNTFIEVSAKPIDGKNGLSGWSVAHASKLTPTTAP